MAENKKKILLIEDDKYIFRAYKDGLEHAGFEVIGASDGAEGVTEAKDKKPDLILLDLILPIKNGFEVLEEIKMDDTTKNIPVIILSNLGQESDVEKGNALGAEDYLIKSNYSMKEVVEKVRFQLVKKKTAKTL